MRLPIIDTRLPRPVQVLQLGGLCNAFGNGVVLPFTLIYLHNVRGISLAVAGLGVPALFIVLTLFDAPVEPKAAVSAAARGAATTGLVLGGLAPAMALFVTTSSSRFGAAFCAGVGLMLAGVFGLRAFLASIGAPIGRASAGVRTMSGFALAGFAIFATALSARVWWSSLPIFGGAQ